jgi:hypothetical protein
MSCILRRGGQYICQNGTHHESPLVPIACKASRMNPSSVCPVGVGPFLSDLAYNSFSAGSQARRSGSGVRKAKSYINLDSSCRTTRFCRVLPGNDNCTLQARYEPHQARLGVEYG